MEGYWYKIAALAIVAYAMLETVCANLLRIIYAKTGIFYMPRRAPFVSAAFRAFMERFLSEGGEGKTMRHDPLLGWTLRPGAAEGLYKINLAGARAEKELPPHPAAGRARVATFGDCLTFGEDVPFAETWQQKLETICGRCETVNFGVDGYGPGQMYLHYLESLKALPGQDIAVMAVVSTNVFKPLNTFRPFYSYDHGIKLAKPAFAAAGDSIEVIPNPAPGLDDYRKLLEDPAAVLKEFGRRDHYFSTTYRGSVFDFLPSVRLATVIRSELKRRREVMERGGVLKKGSLALETSLGIYRAFREAAISNGTIPFFIFLPLKKEIERYMKKGVKPYGAILESFEKSGFGYVDMLNAFAAHAHAGRNSRGRRGVREDRCLPEGRGVRERNGVREAPGGLPPGGYFIGRHYSPEANGIIAGALSGALARYVDDILSKR